MPMPQRRALFVVFLCFCIGMVSSSALAETYGNRVLRHGARGEDALQLQQRLQAVGYPTGPLDGVFGWRTRSAVAAFQRDLGLPADGVAEAITLGALARAADWQDSVWYSVIAGDTLSAIARRGATQPETLVRLNRLAGADLYPGQVLRVPRSPGTAPELPVVSPALELPPDDPGPVQPAPDTPAPEQPNPVPPSPGQPAPVQPEPAPQPEQPAPDPVPPQRPAPPGPVPIGDLPRPLVLGYYATDWATDRRSWNSLSRNVDIIQIVAPFQYRIDAAVELEGADSPDLVSYAGQKRVHVWAVIHNMAGGRFDARVARAILATPAARQMAADRITAMLLEKGFSGVNIDIEAVPRELRAEYTHFVELLAARMRPLGLGVSLAIPAKTFDNPRDGWSGAFDYAALGRVADYLMIMSYDEHSPGFPAGPVASLPWVRKVMTYASSQVPADKLLMGVAAYGYDWAVGTTKARAITEARVVGLIESSGANLLWNEATSTPYFFYEDAQGVERVVHFENARSLTAKLQLLPEFKARGIGLWRLGFEGDALWVAIRQELLRPAAPPPPAPGAPPPEAPAPPVAAGTTGR